MQRDDLPVHDIPALDGNNAPVHEELVLEDLPAIGEVPPDLNVGRAVLGRIMRCMHGAQGHRARTATHAMRREGAQ